MLAIQFATLQGAGAWGGTRRITNMVPKLRQLLRLARAPALLRQRFGPYVVRRCTHGASISACGRSDCVSWRVADGREARCAKGPLRSAVAVAFPSSVRSTVEFLQFLFGVGERELVPAHLVG